MKSEKIKAEVAKRKLGYSFVLKKNPISFDALKSKGLAILSIVSILILLPFGQSILIIQSFLGKIKRG